MKKAHFRFDKIIRHPWRFIFCALVLIHTISFTRVVLVDAAVRGSGFSPPQQIFQAKAPGTDVTSPRVENKIVQAQALNKAIAQDQKPPKPQLAATTKKVENQDPPTEATSPAPVANELEDKIDTTANTVSDAKPDAADMNENPPMNILEQIRAAPPFDPEKTVSWLGGDCGCVVDFSGVVYGFYPYWLAGAPQEIDFSLLSRIAYHALSLDHNGKISSLKNWNPKAADFITEAQRHQTQVDLVIYKNDWEEWFTTSARDRLYLIDETTTNIVNVVDQKIADTSPINLKKVVASESSTKMGDGVTLFFDAYPEDKIAVEFFLDFVETLRKKLKATGEDYALNLMLPMSAIGKGVYTYQNLEEFMNNADSKEDDEIDLYLVILEGAADDASKKEKGLAPKKVLRAQIEKEFSGIRRRNMLRKIVPVVQAVGEQSEAEQQFEDDLIYFEDNFGGVGFWPLPLVGAPETEDVNAKVESVFKQQSGLGFIAQNLPVNDTDYCKFVCPNRWAFRLTYDLLFVLLGAYALIATRSPLFRNLFEAYRFYFMGLAGGALLIFYSALMCDPYLSDKKGWAAIAFVLGLLFYWVLRSYFKMKREDYP